MAAVINLHRDSEWWRGVVYLPIANRCLPSVMRKNRALIHGTDVRVGLDSDDRYSESEYDLRPVARLLLGEDHD